MSRYKVLLLSFMTICVMLLFAAYYTLKTDDEVINEVQFTVAGDELLKFYKSDKTLYAFIPSGIELSDVVVSCPKGKTSIGNRKIISGESFLDLDLSVGETYSLTYGHNKYELILLQSENVPTMFVNNATGNFEEVLSDKDHKEPIRFNIIDKDGNQLSSAIGDISGRGNTSWKLDKKPFNLYLESEISLLGLQASDKYCLLANGFDESNIRNKLIYDFAKKVDKNWTPGCEFVDLYVNGEYYGLYMLSESVQVADSKIDISQENGYWYSMSIPSRKASLDDYIVTDDERIVEVKYSQNNDYENLLERLNLLEEKLKDGTGEELIDIDSWVTTYLIEEIFANTDICSLYFYWDSSSEDNKIFAGPHWDYDNSLGNAVCNRVKQPSSAQIASQPYRFVGYGNSWFSELVNSPDFIQICRERYQNEYRQIIDDMLNYQIDDLAQSVEKASYCNSIRWSEMYDGFVSNDTADEIKQYFRDRIAFLDSLWIDGDDWCSIRINRGEGRSYIFYSVRAGEKFSDLPDGESLDVKDIAYFVDEITGEKFSSSEIIGEDRYLKAVFVGEEVQENTGLAVYLKRLIGYAPCLMFFAFLAYLAYRDRRLHSWEASTDTNINI